MGAVGPGGCSSSGLSPSPHLRPIGLLFSCYQGAKGFVTFKKRLPGMQAKADAAAGSGSSEGGDASDAGPLRLAFLGALGLALAGACIGEPGMACHRGLPCGSR